MITQSIAVDLPGWDAVSSGSVQQLLSHGIDDAFRDLVARASKGQATPDERAMLLSEGVRERYRAALLILKRDAESQLVDRKAHLATFKSQCIAEGDGSKSAYFAKENGYQRWRAGLLRYKNGIEENLAELRALHSQATQQPKTPGSMTAGERRQRGEAIDARLDRIESMLERLLAIAERGE